MKAPKLVEDSPKVYATSDIIAAKRVLDRILRAPSINEVLSVKPVIKVIKIGD